MKDDEIEKIVLHNFKMIHNKIILKFFYLENEIDTLSKRIKVLEGKVK